MKKRQGKQAVSSYNQHPQGQQSLAGWWPEPGQPRQADSGSSKEPFSCSVAPLPTEQPRECRRRAQRGAPAPTLWHMAVCPSGQGLLKASKDGIAPVSAGPLGCTRCKRRMGLNHGQDPALPDPAAGQTTASSKASWRNNFAFKVVP